MATLERHFQDMCDIEFTVEEGELWVLQCRVGKRSGVAEWIIASDMVDEGLVEGATALAERLTPNKFDELLRPTIRADIKAASKALTADHPASPGAAALALVYVGGVVGGGSFLCEVAGEEGTTSSSRPLPWLWPPCSDTLASAPSVHRPPLLPQQV